MKPTEKHIEQYVKYPSEMSREEKIWIESWVQKDKEIHLLIDWYKEFYAEIDKIERDKNRPKSVPSVIHLTPFQNRSKFSNGFILAAQTPVSRKKGSALKSVKTFVSEEHKTLIRILHDNDERKSKLFVISEYVEKDDIVLINVSEEQSFFVSQPGGTFVISDQTISKDKITDWSQCKLYLPLAKMIIFKNIETGEINIDLSSLDKVKKEINFEVIGDKLNIAADFGDDKLPEKLVLHSKDQSTFRFIEEGKCSIPLTDLKTTNSLLFFY